MVSLTRKLTAAAFAGIAVGFLMYIAASIALSVIPTLPPAFGLAGFGIGFSCAVGATLSEDVKEAQVTTVKA
jgi:hypothetical protein